MKKTFLITCFALATLTLSAQVDTLKKNTSAGASSVQSNEIRTVFGSKNKSNGFYVGMDFGYTQIDRLDAFIGGARFAWIVNQGVAVGLAGRGFVSQSYGDLLTYNLNHSYAGGYGGLLVEPILMPKAPVHLAIPIILGCGGISHISYYAPDISTADPYYSSHDSEFFLVAEPGLELEINAVKWIRITVGSSYKFIMNVHRDESYVASDTKKILEGFSFNLGLKFGKF